MGRNQYDMRKYGSIGVVKLGVSSKKVISAYMLKQCVVGMQHLYSFWTPEFPRKMHLIRWAHNYTL